MLREDMCNPEKYPEKPSASDAETYILDNHLRLSLRLTGMSSARSLAGAELHCRTWGLDL